MAITIKDVAQLAGVSPSTVSRTCKDSPSISNETKEKVRNAMSVLGYKPNFQASNLVNKNSRTIGIILPPMEKEVYENHFYLEAIRGISCFCNTKQYTNTIISETSLKELLSVIESMTRRGQVDGFILLNSKWDDTVIDYLHHEDLLYVGVENVYQTFHQSLKINAFHLGMESASQLIHRIETPTL